MQFLNTTLQEFLQVCFALPNSTPTWTIQVDTIDTPAQHGDAGRLVAIDMVERNSGIKAVLTTDGDTLTHLADRLQQTFDKVEIVRFWRQR